MTREHAPDPASGSPPANATSNDEPVDSLSTDLDPETVHALAREAKQLLRKRARGLRKSMPASAISARSAALVERLTSLPWLSEARSVALFWPLVDRNEVDLRALDATLRQRGATVSYPSIEREAKAMTFRDPGDPSVMVPRESTVCEPDPALPVVERIDVIVVPALLVDPRGHRLGYGGGYYDRTLPRFCPPSRSVVVAFDFQIAAELPIGPNDVACNAVVTDTRVLKDLVSSPPSPK